MGITCATSVAAVPMAIADRVSEFAYEKQNQTVLAQSSFKKVIDIPPAGVPVSTVVALPLVEQVSRQEQFLVYEVNSGSFIPSYLDNKTVTQKYLTNVTTQPSALRAFLLTDEDEDTYVEFPVLGEGLNSVTVLVQTNRVIETSKLSVKLSQYVALPNTVTIKAGLKTSQTLRTIIAQKTMDGTLVTFPKTTAEIFEITFTHAQPLRITELDFWEDSLMGEMQQSLRFLAQPGYSYQVYYDADRTISIQLPESGNLRSDEGIFQLPVYSSRQNEQYVPSDIDGDGVRDVFDNCVQVPNTDQADIDRNGRGDTCDDFDRDGVMNNVDNCINQPNRSQSDDDYDGIGDACDAQESRFTESNPWIPWIGIGTALTVILTLFVLVARGPKRDMIE